jgi:hypothetical protein
MNRKTNLRTRKTRKQSQRKYFLTGGEEKRHAIMSYNMSWASDMGLVTGTERSFLEAARARLGIPASVRSRLPWYRALEFVKQFMETEPDFSAVGLQEINDAAYIRQRRANPGDQNFKGGTDELGKTVCVLNNLYGGKFEMASGGVKTDSSKPTLVTIWNREKLGTVVNTYINELYKETYVAPVGDVVPVDPNIQFLLRSGFTQENINDRIAGGVTLEELVGSVREFQRMQGRRAPPRAPAPPPPPAPVAAPVAIEADPRYQQLIAMGFNGASIRRAMANRPQAPVNGLVSYIFNNPPPPAPVAAPVAIEADPRYQPLIDMGFNGASIRRAIAENPAAANVDQLVTYILEHPAQAGGARNTDPVYQGRPIFIVLTSGGYILINLHGPNKSGTNAEINTTIQHTIRDIQRHFQLAMGEFGVETPDMNKVFIMGDFNDKGNRIKNIRLGEVNLQYGAAGVKSCCSDGTININNYRSYGDYVFGKNLVKSLAMYRKNLDQLSLESDHEPVYAVFKEDLSDIVSGANLYGNGSGRNARYNERERAEIFRNPTGNIVIRALGGLSGARLHSKKNGTSKWVVKDGGPERVEAERAFGLIQDEYAAGQIYRALGVAVPRQRLDLEKRILIGEYIPGIEIGKLKDGPLPNLPLFEKAKAQARKAFVVDLLLGNYDVYGSDVGNNMIFSNGILYRIDNGATFDRNATGGQRVRGMLFIGDAASQIDWLRTPSRESEAAGTGSIDILFKDITNKEVAEQIRKFIVPNREKIIQLTPPRTMLGSVTPLRKIMADRIDSLSKWAKGK